MWRGCFSSFKYSPICLPESGRPNQVLHQNRNGISTISQATRKNRKRFRVDIRGRFPLAVEGTSEGPIGGCAGLGELDWIGLFFLEFTSLMKQSNADTMNACCQAEAQHSFDFLQDRLHTYLRQDKT